MKSSYIMSVFEILSSNNPMTDHLHSKYPIHRVLENNLFFPIFIPLAQQFLI